MIEWFPLSPQDIDIKKLINMNPQDSHHIVFNINNVYITINYQGGTGSRNNNDRREETNQHSSPAAPDVNQTNYSENDKICNTPKVSKNADPISVIQQAAVINQPSTSRLNEILNPEIEDRTGSSGDPEIATQNSDNDEITKSALQQNTQSEPDKTSGLESNSANTVGVAVMEKTANVNTEKASEKTVKTETKKDELCKVTTAFGRTELVNANTKSKLPEKVQDRAVASKSHAKPLEETKQDDDNNKENNGQKRAFNPNLTFNFSPDLLKINATEENNLVLSQKPSFQFTNLRRSAPELFFKFQAKPEEVPSIEESRNKLTKRKIFIRSCRNAKKSMAGDNTEIGKKKT